MIITEEAHYVASLLELAEIVGRDRLGAIDVRSGIDVTDVVDCVGITSLADADPIVSPTRSAAPPDADRCSRPYCALGDPDRWPRIGGNDCEAVPGECGRWR